MKRIGNITLMVLCFAVFGFAAGDLNAREAFELPHYEKFVLDNGLTVYLMEQHEVPLVYVSAVFPAGSTRDGSKYGLASLTAEGLLFGTTNYSKQQIEEMLDYLGASYSSSASRDYASVFMSFVNTDQDRVLPILQEIITRPVFDAEEFEKRQKRLLVELEQAKERPREVIQDYYYKFLYGDHPYGNPVEGTRATVAEITVDDLKTFYKNNYYPAGSAIAVAGDFKTKDMKSKLQELFAGWKTQSAQTPGAGGLVPAIDRTRILLVNKDDATETRFMIGGYGIKRDNPDYVAVEVMNTIFGGRFTSWLNDELRVNRGLTYGAGSRFTEHKDSGVFFISSYTRTETTLEAVDVALELLDRLHSQGVDEKTLNSAKNYVKGQFPPDYETAGDLAWLLTSMFVYEFDESFINDFEKNVDELTVAKSREIVKRYFPKDNLQFVLIGKASEIREQVKKYGEIEEKEIKAVGF